MGHQDERACREFRHGGGLCAHQRPRRLHYTLSILDNGEDNIRVSVYACFLSPKRYLSETSPEHEQSLHIKILRIQFPEPSSSHPVEFDVLGDLITPWSLAAELHFLDAPNRMICAVFLNDETCTAGLHVVLDWNTGLSYIFDTGISYVRSHPTPSFYIMTDSLQGIRSGSDRPPLVRRQEIYYPT